MTITPANRALLERKFGRKIPDSPDVKVTLTTGALCALLDAARSEATVKKTLDSLTGTSRDNLHDVFSRAGLFR